jgi:hypothetical protein
LIGEASRKEEMGKTGEIKRKMHYNKLFNFVARYAIKKT